ALIERAEKQLSGESLSSLVERTVRTRSEKEKVIDQIQESDESLCQNAAQILKIIGLPSDRLPVLEREYFSYRDIAKEKMDWCRHIELIQDKRHELHPATHFKTDPTRFCICGLYGYRSKFGDTDWTAVITAFKTSHCDGCEGKSPFSEPADNGSP